MKKLVILLSIVIFGVVGCSFTVDVKDLQSPQTEAPTIINEINDDINSAVEDAVDATDSAVTAAQEAISAVVDGEDDANDADDEPSPEPTDPPVQPTVTDSTAEPTEETSETFTQTELAVGTYQLDGFSTSSHEILSNIELLVESAEVTESDITFDVAFLNKSDESFGLTMGGWLNNQDFILVDLENNQFEAAALSEGFDSVDGDGLRGTPAGAANRGFVTFPLPNTIPPYTLRFAEGQQFERMKVTFDEPTNDEPLQVVNGVYPVDSQLYSNQDALETIRLAVQTVELTDTEIRFDVGFVNTGLRGMDLMIGPSGEDAYLYDGRLGFSEPIAVSESLEQEIAPEGGWQAGESNDGTITFARPDDVSQLRFVFPNYTAATLTFTEGGLSNVTMTEPNGSPPENEPPVSLLKTTFAELQALLDGVAAERTSAAPQYITSIELTAQLDNALSESNIESGRIEALSVVEMVRFDGVSEDNPFVISSEYTFVQQDDAWQIEGEGTYDDDPPFWTDEVITQETDHFMLFAPPGSEAQLSEAGIEAENAYETLVAKGFTLEAPYLVYFAPTQGLFRDLSGGSNRTLGIATSRYDLADEDDPEDVMSVTNRIFYLNGEKFDEEVNTLASTTLHELVHLALGEETRPFTPAWLAEGAAVYYANQDTADQRQFLLDSDEYADLNLIDLTEADKLGEWDFLGERGSAEYAYSGALFSYIVETYSEEKAMELYNRFAEVPSSTVREALPDTFFASIMLDASMKELRETLTPQFVEEVLGVSLEQLETDFEAWFLALMLS